MNICVFGAASDRLEGAYFTLAEELGRSMARRGHTLVFGGGATGLMGALARGVRAEGGERIGIAPRFFDMPGVLYKECTERIFTETMAERKSLMEDMAEAFIAVPGGIGTYEEFLEVLTLRQLGRHEKPMALLECLGYYAPMQTLLEHTVKAGFLEQRCLDMYSIFQSPEPCLDYLENGGLSLHPHKKT